MRGLIHNATPMNGIVAKASVLIDAPVAKVWDALLDPATAKKYMFGTDLSTDWQVGSEIVWRGEWQGKPYEDKGKILKNEEHRVIAYSHQDHVVEITLDAEDGKTRATIVQDNNKSEAAREHSQGVWQAMLDGIRRDLEA